MFQGDAAEYDVQKQRRQLGRQPRLYERILLRAHGQRDAGREQQRIDGMRQDSRHPRPQPWRSAPHPRAAQHETGQRQDSAADVDGFEVIHRSPF
jgi:hypothetical protein